ncbi:MAG TPA: CCA tRNA nucleotidyltransferase [Phycisphaerales bacterium]|nr:CCA tRNA nucleotidyltransferase [Phycisphaerales bacterium]
MGRPSHHLSARKAAEHIVRTLTGAGHIAYFAGGCVRDELLGLTPTDYDVATDASPDRIAALFPRTAEVGASFGVMLVRIDSEVIEVATFRSDGEYTDRRRPNTVTFSDPLQDAHRRDYTVNALFLDPILADHPSPPIEHAPGAAIVPVAAHGRVIDFVGGIADLERRVLRAVGDPDQRLAEDHLRALRAARLAAKLGLTIDPPTAAAITRHASDLQGVSRERIGEEVRRIAEHPSRAQGAALIHSLGLERPVFLQSGAQGPRSWRTLSNLPAEVGFATALAAWALDLGVVGLAPLPLVQQFRNTLTLSNDVRDQFAFILATLPTLEREWDSLPVARQKRLAASAWFWEATSVLRAKDPSTAARVEARVGELAQTHGGLKPDPYVSGDDLTAMGLTPGPRFKVILDGVYDAQLEGRVQNRDAALELARGMRV